MRGRQIRLSSCASKSLVDSDCDRHENECDVKNATADRAGQTSLQPPRCCVTIFPFAPGRKRTVAARGKRSTGKTKAVAEATKRTRTLDTFLKPAAGKAGA